jgi:hypothetical protein
MYEGISKNVLFELSPFRENQIHRGRDSRVSTLNMYCGLFLKQNESSFFGK